MTEQVYGPTNPAPDESGVLCYGSVIGLNPSAEASYRELHANAWETVIERLEKSHIHNYSIFITQLEGKKYLFSYFEYTGSSFESDMAEMASDPETRRWWSHTDPCQLQLPNRGQKANWSVMERIFFKA